MKTTALLPIVAALALARLAAQNAEPPAPATPIPPPGPAPQANLYPLEKAHLFEPFWKGNTAYGEAVALVKEPDDATPTGTLLFTPDKILAVRSSDGKTEYEEGKDFIVDAEKRRLVLTPGSRIASVERAALYKQKGDKQAVPHKIDDPDVYLLYAEAWFKTIQVVVDYTHGDAWSGFAPAFAGDVLPKTIAKLKSGAGLRITVTGDSISTGANASSKGPPFSPGYVILVQRALQQAYGGTVEATNLALAGTTAFGGVKKVPDIVATQPDLVVIAFGMNDTAGKSPSQYGGQLRQIVDGVRAALPDAEFLVVTSSVANPEWSWSPATQFPPYRDAAKAVAGPGVAVADVTEVWLEILARKRYQDLAGNGINHPNDYGHRLYAQTILALLVDGAGPAPAAAPAP